MDMGLIIKTEYIAKTVLLSRTSLQWMVLILVSEDGPPFKDKPAVDGTNFGYLPKMATTYYLQGFDWFPVGF